MILHFLSIQQPVNVPDDYQRTFDFLQGNQLFEDGIMHFLNGMRDTVWTHFDAFITDAQALSAIFMLIFFAIKSYEMMAGDKPLEVMPLLRPFGLVMIILWWGTFVRVIAYPADIVSARTEAMFDNNQSEVNSLRAQRAMLMAEVQSELLGIQTKAEIAGKEAEGVWERAWEAVSSTVTEGFTTVWNSIVKFRIRMQLSLQLFVAGLMETIAVWILRLCVYIIFLVQTIYSTILIILGPFSIAMSILPPFRDSFGTWIARFISVNLYTGIGYLVMYVGSLFQQFALEAEITRYQHLLDNPGPDGDKLVAFAMGGVLTFGIVIIVFIITGLTMLTVPSISTWIVSTSGISSATGAMGRNAAAMGRVAMRVITKI
jgi:hypothetical protein